MSEGSGKSDPFAERLFRRGLRRELSSYFDDAPESIFRLVRITRDDVPGMPLSLCGELAGRPEHTAMIPPR